MGRNSKNLPKCINHTNFLRYPALQILMKLMFIFLAGVYISGVLAAISCGTLGTFCLLSVIQIAMISSRDKIVMKYKPLVIIKLVLSIASGK